MEQLVRITVFTPTYNRGSLLPHLYDSLKKQTFRDFEWVVVDDGSDDNTFELFSKWILENNDFNIKYIKVNNGGKHRAINKGLDVACGELFFIVDSDDRLPNNSLKIINEVEKTIPMSKKPLFAGVCGLKGKINGDSCGNTYVGDKYLDITQLERKKYNIEGDKAEVFYTELLRKYKFPEFEGERFVTECVVWDKIAYDGYKLRFFNDVVYLCEYLEDGLSYNYHSVCYSNPQGYGLYIRQSIDYGKFSRKEKWIEIYRFFSRVNNYSFKEKSFFLNYNIVYCWVGLFFQKLKRKIARISNRKIIK